MAGSADTDEDFPFRALLRTPHMASSRFKAIIHGHTAFLGLVCAALVAVGLWLMFSSHEHLEALTDDVALERSERIAREFEEVLHYPGADSLTVLGFVGSMRVVDDLAYLVVTDSIGAVTAAYNELGARRAGFQFPDRLTDTESTLTLHRFGHAIHSGPVTGHLYVGFERASMSAGLKRDGRLLKMAGWAMLAVALFLISGIGRFHALETSMSTLRKARRDLAQEKGSLESQMHSQHEKEAELKQSEERYKSLLETTMESAFKDLERQKKNLEKEVEEKTATQKVLHRTMRRLRMLNGIERKIVDEEPLDSIVGHAVEELQELLSADRISVLEIQDDSQIVIVKAESGKGILGTNEEGHIPLEWYRPFKRGLFVARDLNRMSDRFPIEDLAVEHGIQSYCRVTLTAGESVAGALHIGHAQPAHFDEEYLKVIRDVADLLSIALRQHFHHLEREHYNEELIAERDRAEEMARLKTAFLTNMTHEIRTPLSGIIGFAQVLEEELDDERVEFAMHIQSAGKRLMSTINSVLDLSRLQADKASLRLAPLDASYIVLSTLEVLRPLADQKELSFRVDVPSGMSATLDEIGLETVVNNLVGNAIKFTEQGTVAVSLEAAGDDMVLIVRDTGIGISEDFLPMLFDEFRQEYMGADRPAEGSGLGLAITSRIVEKLNGRIEVESTPGEGSTFTVTFVEALKSGQSLAEQRAPERDAQGGKGRPTSTNSEADAAPSAS